MAIKNISGTTLPSFKLRGGRLELISAAVKNEKGELLDEFKVKDSAGDIQRVILERDLESLYDTFIQSEMIEKMSYTTVNGKKTLTLKIRGVNEEIEVPTSTELKDLIKTPDSTTVKGVVLFGSSNGKELIDSQMTIAESIPGLDMSDEQELTLTEDNGLNKTIPTSKAVRDLIGDVSGLITNRLNGNNVSIYGSGGLKPDSEVSEDITR